MMVGAMVGTKAAMSAASLADNSVGHLVDLLVDKKAGLTVCWMVDQSDKKKAAWSAAWMASTKVGSMVDKKVSMTVDRMDEH